MKGEAGVWVGCKAACRCTETVGNLKQLKFKALHMAKWLYRKISPESSTNGLTQTSASIDLNFGYYTDRVKLFIEIHCLYNK